MHAARQVAFLDVFCCDVPDQWISTNNLLKDISFKTTFALPSFLTCKARNLHAALKLFNDMQIELCAWCVASRTAVSCTLSFFSRSWGKKSESLHQHMWWSNRGLPASESMLCDWAAWSAWCRILVINRRSTLSGDALLEKFSFRFQTTPDYHLDSSSSPRVVDTFLGQSDRTCWATLPWYPHAPRSTNSGLPAILVWRMSNYLWSRRIWGGVATCHPAAWGGTVALFVEAFTVIQ